MIKDGERFKEEDEKRKVFNEIRTKAEAYITDTEKNLETFSDFLTEADKTEIQAEMEKLRTVLDKSETTKEEMKNAHDVLSKLTMTKFAAAYNVKKLRNELTCCRNKLQVLRNRYDFGIQCREFAFCMIKCRCSYNFCNNLWHCL